jgi:hypothetical protein
MNVLMFTIYLRKVIGSVTASVYATERARPGIGCTGMQTADIDTDRPSVARVEESRRGHAQHGRHGTNASSALRAPSDLRPAIVKEAHNASSISAGSRTLRPHHAHPKRAPGSPRTFAAGGQQLHTQQCHRDT